MKNTFQITRGGNLHNHLYMWKKEWVRPYESPISAYMNFVMMNALTAGDVRRYWDCSNSSTQYYKDAVINDVYGGSKFIDNLYKHLLPYDSFEFPRITGDFLYRRNFFYCPECIKQGYHSYICQIPFENSCPIHNIPYIDAGRSIPIGMSQYGDYIKLLGVFPLPPEREELDFFKIEKRLAKYTKSNSIHYISCSDHINSQNDLDENNRKCIFTIHKDFDYNKFIDETLMYFANTSSQVLYNNLLENCGIITKERMCKNYEYIARSNQFSRIMEMACLFDYISGLDAQKYPGQYPALNDLYINNEKMPVTKENIRGAYCYSVRGCWDIFGTFDLQYISKTNSWVNRRRSIDTTLLGVLEEKIAHLPFSITFFENGKDYHRSIFALSNIISCICVKDQFWHLAKRFEESLKDMEYFDFYNHWKCLKPLIYEIDICDDKAEIYRNEL